MKKDNIKRKPLGPGYSSKSFKRKDYLRKHLKNCPVLQKIINQGEPSGTQFFPLKDIEQNELTTEALLRMPQTIDQSGSFAMETYCPLESIEQSESLGREAYFPSEVVTESDPSAEPLFPSSMDQGAPPATQLLVLEDSASSERYLKSYVRYLKSYVICKHNPL